MRLIGSICAGLGLAAVAHGCTSSSSPGGADGGAGQDSSTDAPALPDVVITDASDGGPGDSGDPRDSGGARDGGDSGSDSADAGFACGLLGGVYDRAAKSCGTVADCAMVARGCYCGSQPVVGVARIFAAAAQACEAKAASSCALGCPNFPGQVAEDGASNLDGGTIQVLCDVGQCRTVLR